MDQKKMLNDRLNKVMKYLGDQDSRLPQNSDQQQICKLLDLILKHTNEGNYDEAAEICGQLEGLLTAKGSSHKYAQPIKQIVASLGNTSLDEIIEIIENNNFLSISDPEVRDTLAQVENYITQYNAIVRELNNRLDHHLFEEAYCLLAKAVKMNPDSQRTERLKNFIARCEKSYHSSEKKYEWQAMHCDLEEWRNLFLAQYSGAYYSLTLRGLLSG